MSARPRSPFVPEIVLGKVHERNACRENMRALSRRHPASRVMKPDASRHRLPIGSCGDNAHHIELLAQMMRAEAGLHSDQGRRHVGDEPAPGGNRRDERR